MPTRLRPLRRIAEEAHGGERALARLLARDEAAVDADHIGREREADRGDARRRRCSDSGRAPGRWPDCRWPRRSRRCGARCRRRAPASGGCDPSAGGSAGGRRVRRRVGRAGVVDRVAQEVDQRVAEPRLEQPASGPSAQRRRRDVSKRASGCVRGGGFHDVAMTRSQERAAAMLSRLSASAAPRRGDHLGVEARAVLGVALLRLEVDVHQPEALRVAEGPLEVVHQRPGEVAAQVDARPRSRRGPPAGGRGSSPRATGR